MMTKFFQKIKQAFKSNDFTTTVYDDVVIFDSSKGAFAFNGGLFVGDGVDYSQVATKEQLGGVLFKIDGSPATLYASIDNGTTWQEVTLS